MNEPFTGLLLAGIGLVAAVSSWAAVFRLEHWLVRLGVVDTPNERSSHSVATPRGGGAVIPLCVIGGGLVSLSFGWGASSKGLMPFVAGALLIALVSLCDDLRDLPTGLRLTAHLAGALVLIAGAGFWEQIWIPGAGDIRLGWWGIPLTLVWVVGLTNAYNFMDGIDGIAGTQGSIAGLGWVALWSTLSPTWPILAAVLMAGSCMGFLGRNWPPATIFMGDVGSAFLGYALASFGVLASQENAVAPVASLLMVFPFFFDTAFTFMRRCTRQEPVLSAHRSHLYQRLVIAGFSHRRVTLAYAAYALLGFAAAWSWWQATATGAALGLVLVAFPSVALVWTVQRAEKKKMISP